VIKIYPDTHEAGGKPKSITLEDQEVRVNRVVDHWHEAEYEYLKLLADDGRIYAIRRKEDSDWELEAVYPY
jgi:hypothetical protein